MNHVYRILNTLGLALVLVMNGLANSLPLNGQTTGELSAKYPVMITPAPYAFSIWLLIYALLTLFVIYQWLPSQWNNPVIRAVNPWFVISCLLNASWIVLWHYEYIAASVFVMFALLLTLIAIYLGVRNPSLQPSARDKLLVRLPFSIYLGWISVASIVNVAVALYDAGWQGFGLSETTWTLIMIGFAIALAMHMAIKYRDVAFVLTILWALIAIAVANY
ncbi:tryptophan-rich sensory protein [Paenibacillus sp. PL2-23]|uniref:tryptophan-rich sensory protein n=1 Tax=Paenibacillus sp. PL2-23 TaxID=2100729 RepID=UPI0030F98530